MNFDIHIPYLGLKRCQKILNFCFILEMDLILWVELLKYQCILGNYLDLILKTQTWVVQVKLFQHSRRSSESESSSSSSESSSSDDEGRESRRSKSRSKRRKKEKKHRSRSKHSSGGEEADGPLPLSRFFGSTKSWCLQGGGFYVLHLVSRLFLDLLWYWFCSIYC